MNDYIVASDAPTPSSSSGSIVPFHAQLTYVLRRSRYYIYFP